jgi:hypothetical protein
MEPLIHQFSKHNKMPIDLVMEDDKKNAIYDPLTQTTQLEMGGYTTASHRSTDGTKPKNEADRVMDDN